ncbi:MAG: flagellar biosynthesis protein FlhB [Planctomycetota bacterium]|nr:MAG: flagellar biosynthesis protein FlhB [Planctomycetota bacterium]
MADDMGERSEAPTAKRLSEARGKGQIPKSQDLSGVVTLFGAALILVLFGSMLGHTLLTQMRIYLGGDAPGEWFSPEAIAPAIRRSFGTAALVMLPVLAVAFLVAFLGQVVQVGWVISAEPIRPKLTKLNPIAGFKRLFGKRGLAKTAINTVKLVAVLLVAWLVVMSRIERLAILPAMTAVGATAEIVRTLVLLVIVLLALLSIIALADYIYQRWQHTQDLKMTKQEVKDERRSMEGDPMIKGKRLEMARQIVMQRIGQSVPEADVIITNPTHFSVAIKYDTETMRAPRVTAKGVDEVALRIRQIARTHKVPIVERPPLARALYWGIDVGQEIAPEHYEAVAEILAYVYRLENRMPDRKPARRAEAAAV